MGTSNNPEDRLDDEEIKKEQVKLTRGKIGKDIVKVSRELIVEIKKSVGITTDFCATVVSEVCGAVL